MDVNLAADIGNTRTKTGVFYQDEMLDEIVFPNDSPEIIQQISQKYPSIKKAIVSSVVENDNILTRQLKNLDIPILYLDHHTPVPVKNRYKTPETLGKDRLAAVVGAHTIHPGLNVLIIDAGTAIKFDFVSASGEYKGGNISPGMEMRFKSLKEFTSRLPKVSKQDDFPESGYDTESSIRCGVQWGMIYEIEGYVHFFSKKYGSLQIILTGGDAIFFEKKLKNTIFVVPNLVLIGLNNILRYNEKLL